MSAPCPFCGGVAVRDDHALTLADTRLHWMECKTCRARGPCASGRDAANAAWAARGPTAVEASQRALIDALEARLAVLFEGHSPKTPDVKLPDGSLWPHPECRNVRKDALHKATTMLTKSHGRIAIEDLKIGNMVRKGGSRKRGLNRVMHDASLSEFRRMLEYKGKRYGCEIEAVPAAYTSQRCSSCGHTEAGNRPSQAVFACLSCGHAANADLNAAINILAAASWSEAQNACGGSVRPGQQRRLSVKQESKRGRNVNA